MTSTLVLGRGANQSGPDGGRQTVDDDGRGLVGNRRQHVGQEAVAEHTGRFQDPTGLVGQGRESPGDGAGHHGRQGAPTMLGKPGQLADKQGMTPGSSMQPRSAPACRRRIADGPDELLDSFHRRPFEVDVVGVGSQRGHPRPSVLVEFVVPVCTDHEQMGGHRRRDHVVEQVERGGVSPLQVVEHHGDVAVRRQGLEPANGRIQQQHPMSIGILARLCWRSQVTHQHREDVAVIARCHPGGVLPDEPGEVAERLHPRPETRRAFSVPAGAPANDRVRPGSVDRGPGQRCLADPGLAAHQDRRAAPLCRRRQGIVEASQRS